MTRWLVPLAALPLLGGCIIYDSTGKCHGGEACGDDGDYDHDTDVISPPVDTDTGPTDTADTAPQGIAWTVNPAMGTEGTSLVVSFVRADGADTSDVIGITVYGKGTVGALTNRGTEILAPLDLAADGGGTTLDFLVVHADGSADWLGDAFTITDADGGGTGGGGGTDTGGTDTGGGGSGGGNGGGGGTGGSGDTGGC